MKRNRFWIVWWFLALWVGLPLGPTAAAPAFHRIPVAEYRDKVYAAWLTGEAGTEAPWTGSQRYFTSITELSVYPPMPGGEKIAQ
ncbi:MAG TPA: hypothetical protein PKI62_08045 [bacterium]|nr:hypothetical protein [bacterium]HPR88474.1 hypothetical protein [bacterium]